MTGAGLHHSEIPMQKLQTIGRQGDCVVHEPLTSLSFRVQFKVPNGTFSCTAM